MPYLYEYLCKNTAKQVFFFSFFAFFFSKIFTKKKKLIYNKTLAHLI